MNEIQIFSSEEFGQIRVIEQDGEPWFVGKDVTDILGYSNSRKAIGDHVNEEDKGVTKCDTLGGIQDMVVINESGLYSLILSSKLPTAKRFRRWVTAEVLPSIRKTGRYMNPRSKQNGDDKSKLAEARLMNARSRMSSQFLKLANVDTLSKEYKNILVAKAAEVLAGETIISLPKSKQKTYSAKEIGELFDISANKVGRIANLHGLKVSEYGEYYRSKSEHSNKEVDTWVYYDSVIPVFAQLLGKTTA